MDQQKLSGAIVLQEPLTRPALPPCPTCGEAVENIEGFGARTWAWPCGHPVETIIGAGGVTGATILRPRVEIS